MENKILDLAKMGSRTPGRDVAKASLHRLLTNAIYASKVEHGGAIYTLEQPSIVESSVWQEVNTELCTGRRAGTGATRVPQNALLAGLLSGKGCKKPMTPTYTAKPDPAISLLRWRSWHEIHRGQGIVSSLTSSGTFI
jgi:hypothetical protein